MTAARFSSWVNNDLLPNSHLPPGFPCSISPCTACKWLHDLGLNPTTYRKGVYVDGHEREDVIQCRKVYLRKMEILECTHLPQPQCSDCSLEELVLPQLSISLSLFIMMNVSSMQMKVQGGSGLN